MLQFVGQLPFPIIGLYWGEGRNDCYQFGTLRSHAVHVFPHRIRKTMKKQGNIYFQHDDSTVHRAYVSTGVRNVIPRRIILCFGEELITMIRSLTISTVIY